MEIGEVNIRSGLYGKTKAIGIKTDSDIFDQEVILITEHDCMILKRIDLDYTGKSIKFHNSSDSTYRTQTYRDIPEGDFKIDEDDSTEDELIIYF